MEQTCTAARSPGSCLSITAGGATRPLAQRRITAVAIRLGQTLLKTGHDLPVHSAVESACLAVLFLFLLSFQKVRHFSSFLLVLTKPGSDTLPSAFQRAPEEEKQDVTSSPVAAREVRLSLDPVSTETFEKGNIPLT